MKVEASLGAGHCYGCHKDKEAVYLASHLGQMLLRSSDVNLGGKAPATLCAECIRYLAASAESA